jgi:tripeptide aminopeptidase
LASRATNGRPYIRLDFLCRFAAAGWKIMDSERLLNTFLELVQIDSPSGHEAAAAAYCRAALEAAGCTVGFDNSAAVTGSDTGNLIATLPGTAPGRLYFSCHLDCVVPCSGVKPVIKDGIIYSDGSTVLGGDDKAGVAAIIELVRSLGENSQPHPEIKVLLSVQEEVGLIGAKAFDCSEFDGEFCYVLDAGGKPGLVVNGAPYQNSYYASYTGVASHAGIAPEAGISAIKAAARAVLALPQGRLDEITTANVGTISGGAANNIVPESCKVSGEFRSHSEARLLEVKQQINAALLQACEDGNPANGPTATVNISWEVNYHGFYVPEDAPVVKLALEAAAALGLPAGCQISGGGADTNIYAAKGLAAVSLGTGMDKIHSTDECMAVADLQALAQLVIKIAYRFVS